jgi:hypothetical protein
MGRFNLAEPATTATAATSWFSGAFLVLLGFGVGLVSDWFKDRRVLQRERETRGALRRDQLAERRANFQRQTLLELQEAIQDLLRATGAAHVQDQRVFRETGTWQREALAEEINQQILVANRRVLLLTVRVRDQALRDAVNRFRRLSSNTESFTNLRINPNDSELRDVSTAAMGEATILIEQIHERIGEILRTLDDEETALAQTDR